jgi:CRISPR/Cas system-associated exonuclease Cas4 (RecB family)
MMTSPNNSLSNFIFSQSSLQDYIDCQYRFHLRYVQHVLWPAIPSEPVRENEQAIRRGAYFHQLLQQVLLGILPDPVNLIDQSDDAMLLWLENFQDTILPDLTGTRYVELSLVTHLVGYQVVAKFDLIEVKPSGKMTIFDWKTSLKKPKRNRLAERIQSRLYPYILSQAGDQLTNEKIIHPEQIEMIYWFSGYPQQVERFPYNSAQMEKDKKFLSQIIDEIINLPSENFERTADQSRCKYCVYRSLCERGITAGDINELEMDIEVDEEKALDIDFDQIAEIQF